MTKQNLAIPVNRDLGHQAQAVLNDMGLDIITAVEYFLQQVVHKQTPQTNTTDFAEASEAQRDEILFKIYTAVDGSFTDLKNAKGKPAKLGGWEGKVKMADDFNASLDDFEEYV